MSVVTSLRSPACRHPPRPQANQLDLKIIIHENNLNEQVLKDINHCHIQSHLLSILLSPIMSAEYNDKEANSYQFFRWLGPPQMVLEVSWVPVLAYSWSNTTEMEKKSFILMIKASLRSSKYAEVWFRAYSHFLITTRIGWARIELTSVHSSFLLKRLLNSWPSFNTWTLNLPLIRSGLKIFFCNYYRSVWYLRRLFIKENQLE